MRENYTADWAFAIINSIEKTVQDNFPKELHDWPLIKTFNFEPYILKDEFMIFILKDKLSGIVSGPSVANIFDYNDVSLREPSVENIKEWQRYLIDKYSLRAQDAVFIIPIVDSGKNVESDCKLWSDTFKKLWSMQLNNIVEQHYYYKKGINIMSDFYLPPGYKFLREECVNFFRDNPNYNKNIFIMTRFVPGNKLLEKLDTELRNVLISQGFNPIRADDKMYMKDRNLWNNVCVYMLCCKFGIAILEDRIVNEFNPNVALEYGFMRALNKQTLMLSDSGFRNLRADIIGTLRENFDITDIENTIAEPIKKWINELEL
ncbi:hypothetical protein [Clostridium hydrogenum]|uniref:hypothetical protein n=1 Tax=Clostridium hydrogenum TaxID=2855764 RepID=UPI001F33DF59|nr:hypothetical protein [Clostridium hydrogenum]